MAIGLIIDGRAVVPRGAGTWACVGLSEGCGSGGLFIILFSARGVQDPDGPAGGPGNPEHGEGEGEAGIWRALPCFAYVYLIVMARTSQLLRMKREQREYRYQNNSQVFSLVGHVKRGPRNSHVSRAQH